MSKADDFITMLCRDFDFTHGDMASKESIVVRLLALADLRIVQTHNQSGPHSEHDQYVISRARYAADKPYDQDTCARYPWAAAARITYLEGILDAIKPKQDAAN